MSDQSANASALGPPSPPLECVSDQKTTKDPHKSSSRPSTQAIGPRKEIPASQIFSQSDCAPSGFSHWAYESSPFWSLALTTPSQESVLHSSGTSVLTKGSLDSKIPMPRITDDATQAAAPADMTAPLSHHVSVDNTGTSAVPSLDSAAEDQFPARSNDHVTQSLSCDKTVKCKEGEKGDVREDDRLRFDTTQPLGCDKIIKCEEVEEEIGESYHPHFDTIQPFDTIVKYEEDDEGEIREDYRPHFNTTQHLGFDKTVRRKEDEEGEIREDYRPRFNMNLGPNPRRNLSRLALLNIEDLDDNLVLFYFGVLAIQALLLPRFIYSSGRKAKRWGVKLTLYGHTIITSHIYESPEKAKVYVCREALNRLRHDYPDWGVPDDPMAWPANPTWDWIELLETHCAHNGLSAPRHTRYSHAEGCRHEVDILDATYFGALKHYHREFESQNAAAHMALYGLFTSASEASYGFQGQVPWNTFNENPMNQSHNTATKRPLCAAVGTDNGLLKAQQQVKKAKPSTTNRATVKKMKVKGNVNLLPISNCRIELIEVPVVEKKKRWPVTSQEITHMLRDFETDIKRLERVCRALSLETPEIKLEQLDGNPIESNGEYTCAAHFQDHPFLTRAGPIGQVRNLKGSKEAVKEACAKRVIQYLINMVKEDERSD